MTGLDHIPDARDGLTNVQRRLLHWLTPPSGSLQASRTVVDRARRQSELTRGEVYTALVEMTAPFRSRYPLVDGEGNFGSIDGDPPAGSLYTEAQLSDVGDAMFGPGDRRIRQASKHANVEPLIPLGGVFPTLLANGTAEGLASIPPHHLGELSAAITARLEDSSAGLDQILALMPAPDFPGGGEIVDIGQVRDAYATGRGTIRLRAATHLELDRTARAVGDGPGTIDVPLPAAVAVTELPFGVAKGGDDGVIFAAVERMNDGTLAEIGDVQDVTDRHGIRLLFEVKRQHDPERARQTLLHSLDLETDLDVLMVAVVDGKPQQCTLLDLIDQYLAHQRSRREAAGSTDADTEIKADLAALASAHAGERRTKLPA